MKTIWNGIKNENPTFVLLLGLCPALAVTTKVENAYMMGLCVLVILLFSNLLISLLKKIIPENVQIPAYILIIATFVTILEMILNKLVPDLYQALGIYLSLVVVNCIVLGRALSIASKESVGKSVLDAIGIGFMNDNASLDYEIECDASKFMSFETSVPQIFTVDASGNGYAINERPLTDGKVKLAYYAGGSAFYTISATRSDGEIYLYDSQLNKTVNLGEQDYTFHSDATEGTNNTRFVLTLKVNTGETVGITTVEDDKLNKENAIYDLLGRKVQNATKGIFIQNGHKVIKY